MKKQHIKVGLLATAAVAGFVINGHAQSVDTLLDKLVDKGVLSVKEANELREESDKDFTKAYSAKSGMPEWVYSLKFGGDFRGRYESFYFDNAAGVDRHRFRYRLRFGVTAALSDNFEAGFRLTSSEAASGGVNGGDPISGNTTMQDNGSKKFVYIDLAYGKWTPLKLSDWQASFIVGKIENPFVFSDMVFDGDYTPEGAAMQLAYNFNDQHSLKLNGGAFLMDEIGGDSNDPFWAGAQLRLDSTWNKHWSSSVGVAALAIANEQNLGATAAAVWTVPNQNAGNSRLAPPPGTLLNNFNPIVADVSLTYTADEFWHYNAPFPIRLAADFIQNPAADSEDTGYSVGATLGKAGKKGLWELSYRYKYLEGDAWYEEFVDSDFGAFYQAASGRSGGLTGYLAGTNVKGHIIKASFSPYNCLTLNLTAFLTELIQESPAGSESASTRIQMDAVLKF